MANAQVVDRATEGPRVDTPVVSIIVATYNRLHLLRETIDSVRAQTFTEWELIIADDGSTDGTHIYLQQLAARDTRIRPLFMEHVGSMTAMRTAGIRAMKGTWIALLDSDDLWVPEKLAVQLGELDKHPECRWSYTGYHHIDQSRLTVPGRTPALPRPVSGWIVEHLIMFAVAPAPPTLLMRRSLFDEVGGFDQMLHVRSDYDLMLRLAVRSQALGITDDLVMAREHGTRTSSGLPVLTHLQENEVMFGRAWTNAPTRRLRTLCARQRAAQWVSMAGIHYREGRRTAAYRALLRAIHIAPTSPHTWRSVMGQATRQLGLRRYLAPQC
jgi:GT2 family glycosyltransferase